MGDEYPCSARSTVEEYIIEDRLANMSVKSGEGILETLSYLVRRNRSKSLTSNIRISDPE
jgi:hypothetical protein